MFCRKRSTNPVKKRENTKNGGKKEINRRGKNYGGLGRLSKKGKLEYLVGTPPKKGKKGRHGQSCGW